MSVLRDPVHNDESSSVVSPLPAPYSLYSDPDVHRYDPFRYEYPSIQSLHNRKPNDHRDFSTRSLHLMHVSPVCRTNYTNLPPSPPYTEEDKRHSTTTSDSTQINPDILPPSPSPPSSPLTVDHPDDIFFWDKRPSSHHRSSSCDSDRTIRPSPRRYNSPVSLEEISPPPSPMLSVVDSGLGLFIEIPINSIHPRLTVLGARINPPVPTIDPARGRGTMAASPGGTAKKSLEEVWERHHDVGGEEDDSNLAALLERARHLEEGVLTHAIQHLSPPPSPVTTNLSQNSQKHIPAILRCRSELLLPTPPPTPVARAGRTHGREPRLNPFYPETITSCPDITPITAFDVNKVSKELRATVGRISFEDIDGLGSPVTDEAESDDQDEGDVNDVGSRPKTGRRWTLPF